MTISTSAIIAAASALEVVTATVLIADPSLFSWLLFDAAMTPPGQALGRISGFALLSLVGVCWPPRRINGALLPAVGALSLFSALAATYLLYLGIGGQLVGMLLWPAAATHFVFAILLAQAWIRRRAPRRQRD